MNPFSLERPIYRFLDFSLDVRSFACFQYNDHEKRKFRAPIVHPLKAQFDNMFTEKSIDIVGDNGDDNQNENDDGKVTLERRGVDWNRDGFFPISPSVLEAAVTPFLHEVDPMSNAVDKIQVNKEYAYFMCNPKEGMDNIQTLCFLYALCRKHNFKFHDLLPTFHVLLQLLFSHSLIFYSSIHRNTTYKTPLLDHDRVVIKPTCLYKQVYTELPATIQVVEHLFWLESRCGKEWAADAMIDLYIQNVQERGPIKRALLKNLSSSILPQESIIDMIDEKIMLMPISRLLNVHAISMDKLFFALVISKVYLTSPRLAHQYMLHYVLEYHEKPLADGAPDQRFISVNNIENKLTKTLFYPNAFPIFNQKMQAEDKFRKSKARDAFSSCSSKTLYSPTKAATMLSMNKKQQFNKEN